MATLEKIIKETDPAVAKKKGASKNPVLSVSRVDCNALVLRGWR